jgi:protease IV
MSDEDHNAKPKEDSPMKPTDEGAVPAPGQTIVIERRERKGCFGKALSVFLVLIVAAFLLFSFVSRDTGLLPSHLSEKYVAGEVATVTDKVAIVEVEGAIYDAVVEHALKQIRQARDDKHVKAVVLRVDSPGGTVSGSDRIWREVELLKLKGKPVVASMGGMAASGGYYVAAGADTIFAEPTTLTGSIGVIAEFPHFDGLMKKVGVDLDTITTGEWKDAGSMFRPMTAAERARWHGLIDQSYQRFVRVVAQGRKLPLQQALASADGSVFTAEEALTRKLINGIGYLDDAIEDAKKRANLTSVRVIRYTKPISLSDLMLGMSAPKPGFQIDPATLLKIQTPQVLLMTR